MIRIWTQMKYFVAHQKFMNESDPRSEAEKIFARSKLSNTPKPIRFVKGSLRIVLPEVDSRLIENLINHLSLDGNAYRKSICKTLRKYFASNCQGLLKMLSNRLHLTRLHSTCLSKVDPSYHKSICQTLRKYSARSYKMALKMLSIDSI